MDCPCRVTQLPTIANGRVSLTSAGRNEDVLLKIPESSHHCPSCSWLVSTHPASRHHFPSVICLYQCAMLMIKDHSSLTSSQILGEVLNDIMRCQRTSWGFEYLCLITCKRHTRVIEWKIRRTLLPSKWSIHYKLFFLELKFAESVQLQNQFNSSKDWR